MRKGRSFLLAGAGIIGIGLAMLAISLELSFRPVPDYVSIVGHPLEIGESTELSLSVTNVTRPPSAVVYAENATEFNVVITDPEGKALVDSTFALSKGFDFEPTVAGTYTLAITNVGDSSTSVVALFRHPPVVDLERQEEIMFAANLGNTGGYIAILGIVVTSVGAYWTIKERKRSKVRKLL